MIKETITQKVSEMARKNLSNFSEEEQEKVRNELPKVSPETVRYIIAKRLVLEKKCQGFSSGLGNDKKEEILEECMSNLSYVELKNQNEVVR